MRLLDTKATTVSHTIQELKETTQTVHQDYIVVHRPMMMAQKPSFASLTRNQLATRVSEWIVITTC
jgi:hypothetical protein